MIEIGIYKLKQTCGACPEQYDVFIANEQVAYLRLRHGYFYASVPDCGDDIVYEAYPKGDGAFHEDERDFYLRQAIAAVHEFYRRELS